MPTVGYYALRSFGVNDFWALAIAGLATSVLAIANTVKRRSLDAVGLLVIVEVALSLSLLFVTRNPRILLLRASAYTSAAGVYLLFTIFIGRPFMFESSKPMVQARGGSARLAAYERCWDRSPEFRGFERNGTLAWGIALLADAALRTVVVLNISVKQAVWLAHGPGIVTLGAALLYTRHLIPSIRRIVDAEEDRFREQSVSEIPKRGISIVRSGAGHHSGR